MSDWDALFAKAAEIQPASVAPRTNNAEEPHAQFDGRAGKKKKRKRSGQRVEDDDRYRRMLQSRIAPAPDPSTPWSPWMALTDSFSRDRWQICSQWKSSSSSMRKCDNCGNSALNHRITIFGKHTDSKQETWPLLLLCHTRNIRCCAKLVAKARRDPDSFLKAMSHEASILQSMTSIACNKLPHEEGDLLETKLANVTKLVGVLLESKKGQAGKKWKSTTLLEDAIRIVIACDNLYYRLYYLQLVKLAPLVATDTECTFIPHPQCYFGFDCLCIESSPDSLSHSELVQSAKAMEYSSPNMKMLLKHLLQPVGSHVSRRTYLEFEHPLAAIHRFRFHETVSLFHDTEWTSLSKTKDLLKQSANQPLSTGEKDHETPAPALLMEWRDSCRDLLCNLYAYATLSSEVVNRLCSDFFKLEKDLELSKGIIEIGAGTGYIARLLRDAGALVDAWDLHPTNGKSKSMNEYHGYTPPFYEVGKATSFPRKNARNVALLLCYPPPNSPMAFEAFTAYRGAGGKCLLHIGEFKGLTGNKRFEDTLSRTMVCKTRYSCLGWGTDAAAVTIWVDQDRPTTGGTKQVLLPCSNGECGREATRRCRLLRSIVYCSKNCFKESSTSRSRLLRLYMINDEDLLLDFENRNHFTVL
eukprot:scaffold22672_cov141-Cylindrotheca_fusiformis.AAC.4